MGFTTEPPNPFIALEGEDSSLEWRYTLGNESFRQATFGKAKIPRMADFLFFDSTPWIEPSKQGSFRGKDNKQLHINYSPRSEKNRRWDLPPYSNRQPKPTKSNE